MENKQLARVFRALHNEKVFTFVKSSFENSYVHYFKHHEREARTMIHRAFLLLCSSSEYRFKKTISSVNHEIFGKDDPVFWFNRMYFKYKKELRPKKDIDQIGPYLTGKTVLDFGCGAGFLAIAMEKLGYKVITTDVLQYRIPEAQHLLFKRMDGPTHVPFPKKSADTTIAKTVLHHVDGYDQKILLEELRKVTSKRLILEEDTYALPEWVLNDNKSLFKQSEFKRFNSMSKEEQFQCLLLKDYFANAVVFGHSDINFPFEFKTVDQWKELLSKTGFKLTKVIAQGFPKEKLTTNCQVWLICDVK